MNNTSAHALDLTRLIDKRILARIEYVSHESRIGIVVNKVGPVIRVGKMDYARQSYRVAKGVSMANIAVGDEVLMTAIKNGMYVLTQVIRTTSDAVDGNLTCANLTVTGNAVIVGSLSAASAAVTGLVSGGSITSGSTIAATGAISGASIAVTGAATSATVAATGAITGASVAVTGAASSASLSVTGAVTLDGNVALGNAGTDLIGFYGVAAVARTVGYTVTNAVADRVFDANAYTTDELADVLGTLIADLKLVGIIG